MFELVISMDKSQPLIFQVLGLPHGGWEFNSPLMYNARDGESQPRSMVHKENDEYVPSSFGLPRESVDKFT